MFRALTPRNNPLPQPFSLSRKSLWRHQMGVRRVTIGCAAKAPLEEKQPCLTGRTVQPASKRSPSLSGPSYSCSFFSPGRHGIRSMSPATPGRAEHRDPRSSSEPRRRRRGRRRIPLRRDKPVDVRFRSHALGPRISILTRGCVIPPSARSGPSLLRLTPGISVSYCGRPDGRINRRRRQICKFIACS
jgi:hypothetical protein